MSERKVGVGTVIEDYCTRCREVQSHFATVVSGGEVKRAQCLVCGSEHRFRARSHRAASRGGSRSPGEGGGGARHGAGAQRRTPSWDVLVNAAAGSKPRFYSPAASYAAGELILHPTWDLGAVIEVEGQKMEVVFRSGVRRLVCNRDV